MRIWKTLLVLMALLCALCSTAFAKDDGPGSVTKRLMLPVALDLSLAPVNSFKNHYGPTDSKVPRETLQGPNPTSPWSIAFYADFRTHESSAVILRRIGPLERLFGSNLSLDVEAFAGSNTAGEAVVGIALSKTINVAKQLDFKIGGGTTWQPTAKLKDAGFGLLLGFSYRFN